MIDSSSEKCCCQLVADRLLVCLQ